MSRGKVTAVIGGQIGSEGKGSIVNAIAPEYDVHVRVGSPNAGHTFYWHDQKYVQQSIPCGWTNPFANIVIGRGALVNPDILLCEIAHIEKFYPDFKTRLFIDSAAGVLDEHFADEEGRTEGDMHQRIGSTGEGVGLARIARLQRDPSKFRLFRDIADDLGLRQCCVNDTPMLIDKWNFMGHNVLLEGSQGSELSLIHGPWPYVTSVDTNAAQILAEVGIAPSKLTDVVLVCRTYPIRVAGNSGPLEHEITWNELSTKLNRHVEERTTVTKKVRRIGEWDDELFKRACLLNAPTSIALTFADYIDGDLYRCTNPDQIFASVKLTEFVRKTTSLWQYRVDFVGTGEDTVVDLRHDEGRLL